MTRSSLDRDVAGVAGSRLYGRRRPLTCPEPRRIELSAGDGAELHVHHISGGDRGAVILAPGTAMSGLSFLADTTEQSFAEYLWQEGFDVWLFDWRTSPYLPVHETGYTFDDVARFDWPVVIEYVHGQTGHSPSVLAHCLSAPCLLLSLLRGYTDPADLRALVASQVGLHLVMNRSNRVKLGFLVDRVLPANRMVRQADHRPRQGIWDAVVSLLAALWPRSYSCANPACHRQSATYGDIVFHDRINEHTHALMGELVPEVNSTFLQDVAPNARARDVLTDEDRQNLGRLDLPLLLISGRENQMFVPEATERTWKLLREARVGRVERRVFDGFGHLDCYLSGEAREPIWTVLADFLTGDDTAFGA